VFVRRVDPSHRAALHGGGEAVDRASLHGRRDVAVDVHGRREGGVFIDRKGNPRVRGLWATTPMSEYIKTLVTQRVLRDAHVELEASIDDDGARVYHVLGAVFTLPADPPPAPGEDTGAAEPAAELLGLAARI
jgi:hypothetical protein